MDATNRSDADGVNEPQALLPELSLSWPSFSPPLRPLLAGFNRAAGVAESQFLCFDNLVNMIDSR
jgi:hypothetical protein